MGEDGGQEPEPVNEELEKIRKLYEKTPDVYIGDDGIVYFCPLVSYGAPPHPSCRRATQTRRDYPDECDCVDPIAQEIRRVKREKERKRKHLPPEDPPEPDPERRIPLPTQEHTQKAFRNNIHVSVDAVGTIFYDHVARLKEKIAMYAQPVE